MENFEIIEIFNNQWVINIGGGILSGLLVMLITRKFFESKDNREYLQRVNLANNEIIYAIKPFIIDGEAPEIDIIKSMRTATSRKYGLDLNDILSIYGITDNLIKEVMDTSFISHNLKREYCEKLYKLRPKKTETEIMENHKYQALSEYRQRALSAFSMVLGIFSGLLTSYTAFMVSGSESLLFSKLKVLLPSFIAFLMAYLAIRFFALSKEGDTKNETKTT